MLSACRAGTPKVGMIPVLVARLPCLCGAPICGFLLHCDAICFLVAVAGKAQVCFGLGISFDVDSTLHAGCNESKFHREQSWMKEIIGIAIQQFSRYLRLK